MTPEAAASVGVPSDLAIVVAILTASVIVFGGLWRLVKATWGVAQVTVANSKAVTELSVDIKELKTGLDARVTVAQHQELVARIAALEAARMTSLAFQPPPRPLFRTLRRASGKTPRR